MGCSSTKLRYENTELGDKRYLKVNAKVESPQNLISQFSFKDSHESVEFLVHTNHLRIGGRCFPQRRIKSPLFSGRVTGVIILFCYFTPLICLYNVFVGWSSGWFEKVNQAGWCSHIVAFRTGLFRNKQTPTLTNNLVDYIPLPSFYYPVSFNSMSICCRNVMKSQQHCHTQRNGFYDAIYIPFCASVRLI